MGYSTPYTRPVDMKKLEFLHAELRRAKAQTVLELGCGEGGISRSLVAEGFHVTGVDLDEAAVSAARSHDVNAVLGNATTWTDGKLYDAVIASEVIEHIAEPRTLAANAFRHLMPNGLFLVTTPNGFGPWELRGRHLNPKWHVYRSNLIRRAMKKKPHVRSDGHDHCQFFTLRRVIGEVEAEGFSVMTQRNSDFLSLPWRTVARWDVALADVLPAWAVSGWYLSFVRV
jgi:2-polyprenyl-3-methyl-5-hydroxy-6-metoxy-1,4-benzoquinol methylase